MEACQVLRFDFGQADESLVFDQPVAVFHASSPEEVRSALEQAEQARRSGLWLAGFLSYEASPGLDPMLVAQESDGFPLVWLGAYRAPTHHTVPRPETSYRVGPWQTHGMTPQIYGVRIASIHDAIRAGLTYQVNYTMRWDASFSGSAYAWYVDLRQVNPRTYGAYLEVDPYRVASLSPELFFHLDGTRIVTRPMKGTATRGAYATTDAAHRRVLVQSAKEQAENVMIVDLMRNDIGRLARVGTVGVDRLFEVEQYPTVWQLTSTVSAELAPEVTWVDIMKNLFPAGSITGAPKAQTMKIIRDLETAPRGLYCGTIGYVCPSGEALFSVAIRTAVINQSTGRVTFGTGGGITWDSHAEAEYREAWAKAAFLSTATNDFALVETTRLTDGCLMLMDYHTDRLHHAVEYFGWPWHPERVRETWARAIQTTGRWRVRLLYHRDGSVRLELLPLSPHSQGRQSVAYASHPMPPADVWSWHKTTCRDRYLTHHAEPSPWFDRLLYTESGEVTEFTRGNLVVRTDTGWLTPRMEAGLLPGTFRQWLLDTGVIREARLTLQDVAQAEQHWFINSVRGWVPVRLMGDLPR